MVVSDRCRRIRQVASVGHAWWARWQRCSSVQGRWNRFQAGAFALCPECQGSCQRSSAILTVGETKPDDAYDDDDNGDEGNDAADDADDQRVHVVRRCLFGLRRFRVNVFRVRRHRRFISGSGNDVGLGCRRHLFGQKFEFRRRRRCPSFARQLFFRQICQKFSGQNIRSCASDLCQVVVQRLHAGLVLQPPAESSSVAIAEDRIGGQTFKTNVPLLAVEGIEELRTQRRKSAASNVQSDVGGHRNGEEDGCRDVGDVRVRQGDVERLAGDSGEGSDGDVVDVRAADPEFAEARRVGGRKVVADQRVFELDSHGLDQLEVGEDSWKTKQKLMLLLHL